MQVKQLFGMLNLNPVDVEISYRNDWKYPSPTTKMYSDEFYHILMLLIYYGLKQNKDIFANHALLLMLLKIWNGRKKDFIQFCDVKTMTYVVTHMVSKKHAVSKYDSPMNLLANYFVPTLLKKYGPMIKRKPEDTKRLFMQSWSRIRQLFSQNPIRNQQTGKNEAQGGLAFLYYKAKNEGLAVVAPSIRKGDDDKAPGFDDYGTTHIRDEIVQSTTDFITQNSNPTYSPVFISTVKKTTHVSSKLLDRLFKAMHSYKYHDYIYDILTLILSKLNIIDKEEICKPSFRIDIKQKIISSKNNREAKKIQEILDLFLIELFNNHLSDVKQFKDWSNVQQIQIRASLIYAIIQNLIKNICHGQLKRSTFKYTE